MIRSKGVVLGLVFAFAVAGCEQLQSLAPPARTAVVDLDAIAKALGRDEVFKQRLEAAGQEINTKLGEFGTKLQTQINEERAKIGTEETAESRQQVQRLMAQVQRQVQQARLKASQEVQKFRQSLYSEFHQEVRPVAERIARNRGASAVLTTASLLWFDPAIDISNEVVAAMKAQTVSQ